MTHTELQASSFIDKIIKEYQEHLEKGNTTLGSLPDDWKIALSELLEEQTIPQKQLGYHVR